MTERPLTVGTAGHIDHGKTALIAALTGVDTDRLPQEKARGISIELGYAPLILPSGRRLSVVDVPGHERFVRTMVAGVTGIDLFLLVIACDDGVMPQTREHVAILRMLGLERGVIALTKRDLVDEDTAELARLEAEELLPGVSAVHVSSRTGEGLDVLRALLDEAAAAAEHRSADGPVRLPVDRSFSLRGIGTVVTGTLWSGTVRTGDRLALEPGGREARVRSVEVHDQPEDEAGAGQRVALALVGVERREVGRGDTLATPGSLRVTYRLECDVSVLPDAPHGLRQAERVTVHLATSETAAKVAVRGGEEIAAGASGRVQLRLAQPVAAHAGDRVILRLTAPQTTVAGGRVLDAEPTRSGAPRAAAEVPAAPAPARPLSDAGADELEQRLAESPFAPPALSAADQAPAAYLAAAGRIVRAGRDLAFTRAAFDEAQAAAIEIATEHGAVTIAQLRDRLGCSRRYAQALLEALDAHGITRRVGDERILRRRARAAAGDGGDTAAS
ncbi:MAG TPA: selenocysteine-specific translation elongation factor [Gaiellales bacterium]|nr:selenocysteine-specific translation elongation factor [Gaiellales bacterium]